MSESSAGDFSLVETMLWNDEKPEHGFPLLQLHLERLDDSASYFAFPFDRAAVLSALDAEVRTFDARPRKVRLLLGSDGNIQLTSELLPAPMTRPLRIRIAAQRTDPADAMYFHKTTHRQLYAEAFEAAAEAEYADVLFLNLRDEVTEGAIHNIFVEKNGCLITPPVECGLLAGVYRRHIMETRRASESVLRLADLREADGVYLSNAVRGLRRAHIDWE
jgi:para-aminobenzoate synthetase/4-amino-4-deoxychorismate lyase